jgi:hypothetical protein
MRRAAAAVSLVVALAAVGVGLAAATPGAARDVRSLAEAMQRLHPDLYASTPRARFRAEATSLARRAPTLGRPQLVVGLMRLVALAGPRNGHTAVYPYDYHPRPLHVYPLRLYAFPSGLHVVAAPASPELVGARLTAVEDVPIERIVEAVRPLVARDNASGFLDFMPEYVVTEEVLVGRGLTDGGSARMSFADGRTVALEPVAASSFASVGSILAPLRRPAGSQPLWLRETERTQWLTTIDRGRALYLGYRLTTDETWTISRQLLRLASRPGVRRVIVDARLNHGGNNMTYGALLGALGELSKRKTVALLIGRSTFSAAGNFAADVDALPRVRLVGEATGGAPSQWGDSSIVEIPSAGLIARVATSFQRFGNPSALTTRPDVAVQLTVEDFLAGRDPVLARALQLR